MGHTHRYKFGFMKKKLSGKESQYMVSRPELGSDSPIGSDRESGCDTGTERTSTKARAAEIQSHRQSHTEEK